MAEFISFNLSVSLERYTCGVVPPSTFGKMSANGALPLAAPPGGVLVPLPNGGVVNAAPAPAPVKSRRGSATPHVTEADRRRLFDAEPVLADAQKPFLGFCIEHKKETHPTRTDYENTKLAQKMWREAFRALCLPAKLHALVPTEQLWADAASLSLDAALDVLPSLLGSGGAGEKWAIKNYRNCDGVMKAYVTISPSKTEGSSYRDAANGLKVFAVWLRQGPDAAQAFIHGNNQPLALLNNQPLALALFGENDDANNDDDDDDDDDDDTDENDDANNDDDDDDADDADESSAPNGGAEMLAIVASNPAPDTGNDNPPVQIAVAVNDEPPAADLPVPALTVEEMIEQCNEEKTANAESRKPGLEALESRKRELESQIESYKAETARQDEEYETKKRKIIAEDYEAGRAELEAKRARLEAL